MCVNTGASPHHIPSQAQQITPDPVRAVTEKGIWGHANVVTVREVQTPVPSALEVKRNVRESIRTMYVKESAAVSVPEKGGYTVITVIFVPTAAVTKRQRAANAAEPEE